MLDFFKREMMLLLEEKKMSDNRTATFLGERTCVDEMVVAPFGHRPPWLVGIDFSTPPAAGVSLFAKRRNNNVFVRRKPVLPASRTTLRLGVLLPVALPPSFYTTPATAKCKPRGPLRGRGASSFFLIYSVSADASVFVSTDAFAVRSFFAMSAMMRCASLRSCCASFTIACASRMVVLCASNTA